MQPTPIDSSDIVLSIDHDYTCTFTSDSVKAYVSGFIARRIKKFTQCVNCETSLTTEEASDRNKLIELKTRGKLLKPSEQLYKLISLTDDIAMKTQ